MLELKRHAPFTLFGALTGILCMFLFRGITAGAAQAVFYVFHPGHVLLSGMATTGMFLLYAHKRNLAVILLVGVAGGIGIATLSDSIIPFIGEQLLGIEISGHGHGHVEGDSHGSEGAGHEGHLHEEESAGEHADANAGVGEAVGEAGHEHEAEVAGHEDHRSFVERAHIGFIEKWYVIFPIAIAGVLIAYWRPKTKFPHAGHVLLSTWASSFHVLMEMGGTLTVLQAAGSLVFLFLAVWLPCCISDIVFPLLFVKTDGLEACCHH